MKRSAKEYHETRRQLDRLRMTLEERTVRSTLPMLLERCRQERLLMQNTAPRSRSIAIYLAHVILQWPTMMCVRAFETGTRKTGTGVIKYHCARVEDARDDKDFDEIIARLETEVSVWKDTRCRTSV